MHKQRITLLVLSGIGAISTFLPWINIPIFGGINGLSEPMEGIGWIPILLFLSVSVISLVGTSIEPIKIRAFFIIPSLVSGYIALSVIKKFNVKISDVAENDFFGISSTLSIGYGLYLIILCSILILVLGFVLDRNNPIQKEQPQSQPKNNLADEHQKTINQLQQLKQLLDNGTLTTDEFEEEKSKLLKSLEK